ncbi:hypothetical protein HMPREF1544_12126 [Mucor circinelloides 1006PhL]|uniref:Uncharacterized protein n=1 Tax=Mucor circinelloides f. circinelloides (strain 1006PhL) TaxID=1220926 RepID=S2IZ65_MUCC1|nr:hypothetical protein HMPREF1544_12126 [Mucor circinelloides 1006PhL]
MSNVLTVVQCLGRPSDAARHYRIHTNDRYASVIVCTYSPNLKLPLDLFNAQSHTVANVLYSYTKKTLLVRHLRVYHEGQSIPTTATSRQSHVMVHDLPSPPNSQYGDTLPCYTL